MKWVTSLKEVGDRLFYAQEYHITRLVHKSTYFVGYGFIVSNKQIAMILFNLISMLRTREKRSTSTHSGVERPGSSWILEA